MGIRLCRVSVRPSCLRTSGAQGKDEQKLMKADVEHRLKELIQCVPENESVTSSHLSSSLLLNGSMHSEIPGVKVESSTGKNTDAIHQRQDADVVQLRSNSSLSEELSFCKNNSSFQNDSEVIRINGDDTEKVNYIAVRDNPENMDRISTQPCSSDMEVCRLDKDPSVAASLEDLKAQSVKLVDAKQCSSVLEEIKSCELDSPVAAINYVIEDSEDIDLAISKSTEGNNQPLHR
ncbi:hypothetical protein V6N11_043382 [Hibiscus sabdariffa]|uniref:Uncharacterized protein n=1 Tax=Hibiscus sabdariffa TaxID=183260 RepID=A0ABR1Z6H9_9ROSI